MKLGIFSEAFSLEEQPSETKFSRVGRNTGNLAFFRAIKKLFQPDFLKPYYGIHNNTQRMEGYDAFLTTDLVWINENIRYENTEKILKNIGDRALIPVSVGLQCAEYKSDFDMHPNTLRLLHEIQERCVIGVRGQYTAEVLDSYGVRNIEIIGCPSVYYQSRYHLEKQPARMPLKTVCSFKTFWGRCSDHEIRFLDYCRKNQLDFVEQTAQPMSRFFIRDCVRFEEWLERASHLFFDVEEWEHFLSDYDFYIGMRFHGGVLAMQNQVRPLFVVSDSRVRELTEFFGLPSIEVKEFKLHTSLKKYYMKTDYDSFYEKYERNKDIMRAFAAKNHLTIDLQ